MAKEDSDLLSFITNFNLAMFIIFLHLFILSGNLCCGRAFKNRKKPAPAGKNHHFAVLIAARHEVQ